MGRSSVICDADSRSLDIGNFAILLLELILHRFPFFIFHSQPGFSEIARLKCRF